VIVTADRASASSGSPPIPSWIETITLRPASATRSVCRSSGCSAGAPVGRADSGSKTAGSRSYSTLIRRQASSAIVAVVATTAVTDLRENPGRAQYFWLDVG